MRRLALFVIALVVAGGIWLASAFNDRTLPAAPVTVVIPPGISVASVAVRLYDAHVIANPLALRILSKLRGADRDIGSGRYEFSAHQSLPDILATLRKGGAPLSVRITIPEGFTAKQIATRLSNAGIAGEQALDDEFAHATFDVDGVHVVGLEGLLFPDTYDFTVGMSPHRIAQMLTREFAKQLPKNASQDAKKLGITLDQALIIASIVEREARVEHDRPLIASVMYNRLREKMPLQVDATVEYALPVYKSALSLADLHVDSPYNTYEHQGLPPGPISNPGLPSIIAALHPAKTEYLYYVAKGDGTHAFATTLAQHNANVAKYEK